MKKGSVIIANAVVWGIVTIACSIALQDTEAFQYIQPILALGAVVSLLVVATAGMGKTVGL
jgi:hypothetical protein